jgi:hypothetical protein
MRLGLFSLVTLFADDIHKARAIAARSARWYAKQTITFSDALAAVRRQLWADQTFAMSRHDPDPQEPPDAIIHRLVDLACYAPKNAESRTQNASRLDRRWFTGNGIASLSVYRHRLQELWSAASSGRIEYEAGIGKDQARVRKRDASHAA